MIIGGEEKAPVKKLRPDSRMEFEKFGLSHVRVRIRQNCANLDLLIELRRVMQRRAPSMEIDTERRV